MVPVAVPSAIRAFDALESVSVIVSPPSSMASSSSGTLIDFAASPGLNVSVPVTWPCSPVPAVAVPSEVV